jgi:SpoVK/Ycf46/Vps4 family AAA+-type ATPase
VRRPVSREVTSRRGNASSLSEVVPSLREDLHFRRPATVAFVGGLPLANEQLARRLAAELGRNVLGIDLDAVVSKYVGETEKNLSKIFVEAGALGAVLFFDEGDALFGKRTDVHDARDRSADVSIVLQELERYQGLLILSIRSRHRQHRMHGRRHRVVLPHPSG